MSGQIVDDAPLVPEGEYQLRYIDYRTCIAFKVPRVVVRFKILDFGQHLGKELECWYRVKSLKGKPKKSGNFVVGKKTDLFRDYVNVVGVPTTNRRDRLSFASLHDKVVIGLVRTVKQDRSQNKLSEEAWYSVVDRLLRTD